LALTFLSTFAFAGLESTFAMWSRRQFGWGPLQNGYLFAYVGVLSAFIQGGLVGRLARRFGEATLIIQGAIALAVGIFLIPFSNSLFVLLIAMTIAGYGFSVISPSLNSLISLQVGEDEQGGIMGVTRSASTMARFTGPAWAGFLFGSLGRDGPYFAGAIIMVVVALLGARALKSIRRPEKS
jgi:DHA1 family tetracycline resistance protein-like MFS transporter